jgi:hypothetical protein
MIKDFLFFIFGLPIASAMLMIQKFRKPRCHHKGECTTISIDVVYDWTTHNEFYDVRFCIQKRKCRTCDNVFLRKAVEFRNRVI